ncbi:DUF4395 domain-containing protein [Microbacterium testaceum]|uniref:DUF4395 domain-containing protein n=1 Tax=Microbacterium testaceum TaxID=2033 RepID=A0A147FAT6_MICTE|nr:DUF4395 domain-containing protein [Microbacterium testaceum]KTS13667.1 hypothetical protein RSA3_03620 [Microbacterium testaceum]
MAEPARIDARGPRFAASITAVLLLVGTLLSLLGVSPGPESALDRATDPGFLLILVVALLFVWGVASPRTAPWGVLYRKAVQPRLAPPTEFEDPRPPRFAQGVGLFVTAVGLILHLAGVPWALPIAAAMAFVAAFLNAVFGLCLGCQLYLVLQRAGLVGRRGPASA